MSIFFHEGLPGAGKSYEAAVYHIIPALRSRRSVITNIDGINHQKFADLAGIPISTCLDFLICIESGKDEENVKRVSAEFVEKTPDNALVVWDEIQDYWPAGRERMPTEMQNYVTEHRHHGLDIILMGQDRDDVHKIWRNRIETVVYFCKLKAVGLENRYRWEYWQVQSKKRLVKTASGVRSYDKKYFGLYASHTGEHVHSDNYKTGKTNLLKGKGFTVGLPVFAVLLVWSFGTLKGFFSPAEASVSVSHVEPVSAPAPKASGADDIRARALAARDAARRAAEARNSSEPSRPASAPAPSGKRESIDYFDKIAAQYRLRLPAVISSPDGRVYAMVEALDSTYHVQERFNVDELRAMGWSVEMMGYGLRLEKQGVVYVARSWPLDKFAQVDVDTRQRL